MASQPTNPMTQIVGDIGSGCRRLTFHFISPARQVAWITPQWDLYAPSLWKLASEYHIQELIGLECSDRKQWRTLFSNLIQSQALDAVVIDRFKLRAAEGFFLQKIARANKTKILIIDSHPHSFCSRRLHLNLSHQSFRFFWSKGGSPTPRHLPFTFFQDMDRLYSHLGGLPCTL